jgi:hypothetical protein
MTEVKTQPPQPTMANNRQQWYNYKKMLNYKQWKNEELNGKGRWKEKCLMLGVSEDDCESNYKNKMTKTSVRTRAYIVDLPMTLKMKSN